MKNFILVFAAIAVLLVIPHPTFAQMGMMNSLDHPTPTQSDLQDEQNMQEAGQTIYQNLQDKKITCQQLTSADFEKLGEYFMGQASGNTQNHVNWDKAIQQMMGERGDTQMHIVWGERGSGCFSNVVVPSNTPSSISGMMQYQDKARGGEFSMMGWGGYGYGGMMYGNFGWGFGLVHFIIALIVVIDLVLAGIWLWQQVSSHKRK